MAERAFDQEPQELGVLPSPSQLNPRQSLPTQTKDLPTVDYMGNRQGSFPSLFQFRQFMIPYLLFSTIECVTKAIQSYIKNGLKFYIM